MTAPRMRAGHSDRQAAVDTLTRHFTDGRLAPDEFEERVGKAYAATHLDELPELLADLPEKQQRPAYGPGAGWPGPDRSGPYGPAGRPGPWPGPVGRPQFRRAPRILAAFVLLALLFSISAVTHGVFPFPLIWIAIVLLFISGRARRRRWAEYDGYNRR